MDIDRYQTLADAYGGDLGRWPPGEQPAALAFRAREPEAAQRILAEAARLDAALDDWRPPAASPALRDRILAAAPRPRAAWGGRFGLWLSGAGLAAACAAGIVVGMAGSSAAVSDARADELLAAAAPDDSDTTLAPLTVLDRQPVGRSA